MLWPLFFSCTVAEDDLVLGPGSVNCATWSPDEETEAGTTTAGANEASVAFQGAPFEALLL